MISDFNFNIKDIGPINEANMQIGKINVIGGLNATGKSTASKLLYCFLKGNIKDRKNFALNLISRSIRNVIIHSDLDNYQKLRKNDDIDTLLWLYNDIRLGILSSSDSNFYNDSINDDILKIDKQIKIIEKNDNKLYSSILNNLLSSEFSSLNFKGKVDMSGLFKDNSFNYSVDFDKNEQSNKGFFTVNDVFYIDSFSILDVESIRLKTKLPERISYLTNSLSSNVDNSKEFLDEEFNKKIIDVESKINKLINGKFESKNNRFSFVSEDGNKSNMDNTSSGIKQIGIIQILLANRKLKEDCFLIIDEPEVNLHPEWQFKLAEILVILAKELNITIYINTHSPMFIESVEVFSKYYNLENETNFYLTQKTDNGNYNFVKCDYDNLYEIYDNLAKPFDAIEVYRLKAEYKNEKNS